MEQTLDIVSTKKGMKEYKNIYLKPYNQYEGITIGNHVIVESTGEKVFPIKTAYGEIFGVKVNYLGEQVGIVLTQAELDNFNKVTNEQANVQVKVGREEIVRVAKGGKLKQLIGVLTFSAN